MELRTTIRTARRRSRLTLRSLAAQASTSHAAIAAYESGRTAPSIETLERIVQAAGFSVDVNLERRIRGVEGLGRGDELVSVLELASAFPAEHSPTLDMPVFGHLEAVEPAAR